MIKFLNKTPRIELLSLSNLFVVNKVWIILFKTLFLQCLQCRKRKYSFTLPHGVYIRLNIEGCTQLAEKIRLSRNIPQKWVLCGAVPPSEERWNT